MKPKETIIEIKLIVEENSQKLSVTCDDKTINSFEMLGILRYAEKTTYLNMINSFQSQNPETK